MFSAKIDCWDEREECGVPTTIALGEEGERESRGINKFRGDSRFLRSNQMFQVCEAFMNEISPLIQREYDPDHHH